MSIERNIDETQRCNVKHSSIATVTVLLIAPLALCLLCSKLCKIAYTLSLMLTAGPTSYNPLSFGMWIVDTVTWSRFVLPIIAGFIGWHFAKRYRVPTGVVSKVIHEVTTLLAEQGIRPSIFSVRTPDDVRLCCSSVYAVDATPFFIIAAGDGTVNAVLSCLIPGTTTIAILPLGTANVLAAELGITSVGNGIERIIRNNTLPLSTGLLTMGETSMRFGLMAGFGLDGATVRDVGQPSKRFLKQGAYFLSALRNIILWDATPIEVITSAQSVTCNSAIVCNASRYGGDFVLAPGNSPFATGLTVICLTGTSLAAYLKGVLSVLLKTVFNPSLLGVRTTDVEISGVKPIQIDGDFVGYSPAKLSTENDIAWIVI